MALIEFRSVSKIYHLDGDGVVVNALNAVNMKVEKGEFVCLSGRSGSGKTTLLNMLGCIDTPTSGEIVVDGRSLAGLGINELAGLRSRTIGFIFQNFNLIPVLNVRENVAFPFIVRPETPKSEVADRVEAAIADVDLKDQEDQRPDQLSGGQRQRVAIARALVTDPKIVLADEPTANLDSQTSKSILEVMKAMNQKRGTTFIFSSHDSLVVSYAGRIIKISDGVVSE